MKVQQCSKKCRKTQPRSETGVRNKNYAKPCKKFTQKPSMMFKAKNTPSKRSRKEQKFSLFYKTPPHIVTRTVFRILLCFSFNIQYLSLVYFSLSLSLVLNSFKNHSFEPLNKRFNIVPWVRFEI